MRLSHLFTAALLNLLLVSSALAQDTSSYEESNREFRRSCKRVVEILKRMDLSDAQKSDVADSLNEYKDGIEDYREPHRQARRALAAEVYTKSIEFNEEAIRELHADKTEIEQELSVLHASYVNDLKGILTTQQYRLYLRSAANMHVCTHAPRAIFGKLVENWLDQQGS